MYYTKFKPSSSGGGEEFQPDKYLTVILVMKYYLSILPDLVDVNICYFIWYYKMVNT